jgi:hypothetical protein
MIGLQKLLVAGDQVAAHAGFLVHHRVIAFCSVSNTSVVWTRQFLAHSITRSLSYTIALLANMTTSRAANAAISLREIGKFAKADT